MPFTSALVVEERTDWKWVLREPLTYRGSQELFLVPEGFVTDFASVPRVLWGLVPPYGKYTKAAVLHDWLYRTKVVSRRDADGLFRRCMRELGVGWPRRRLMWGAVRIFGWAAWR